MFACFTCVSNAFWHRGKDVPAMRDCSEDILAYVCTLSESELRMLNPPKTKSLSILFSYLTAPKSYSEVRNVLTGHIEKVPIEEFRSESLAATGDSSRLERNSKMSVSEPRFARHSNRLQWVRIWPAFEIPSKYQNFVNFIFVTSDSQTGFWGQKCAYWTHRKSSYWGIPLGKSRGAWRRL